MIFSDSRPALVIPSSYIAIMTIIVLQGDFFHWYPPISVLIRKLLSSQSRPFLVTGYTGTAAVIGWLAIIFLVLKLGGTSEKNHPVVSCCELEKSYCFQIIFALHALLHANAWPFATGASLCPYRTKHNFSYSYELEKSFQIMLWSTASIHVNLCHRCIFILVLWTVDVVSSPEKTDPSMFPLFIWLLSSIQPYVPHRAPFTVFNTNRI